MHSRVILTLMALLLMAFAGCTDTDDGSTEMGQDDSTDGDDGSDDSGDGQIGDDGSGDDGVGNSTDGGENGTENTAPTATLSASIKEGAAPVDVNFTLDGSDADGDEFTWTFDADGNGTFEAEGNGTEFPVNFTFTYDTEGTYNATLTVSDGAGQSNETIVINITAAGPSGPSLVIQGSTSVPGNPTTSLVTGANGCIGFNAGENNVDCVFGDIPDGLAGRTFTRDSSTSAPYHEFWDSCDPTGTVVEGYSSSESGSVPDGAGCVVMWTYSDGTGSFTFTVD